MIYGTKKIIRALAENQKAHLTDHISDLWNFIISSEPVINYTNDTAENINDFRYKAINKWLFLNKQRINLDFGYFENSGSDFGKILLDKEIQVDNSYITPNEDERQTLIKSYVRGIDEILSDTNLKKHKILMDYTRQFTREIEFLNSDLKVNNEWKEMCKKWRII